MSCALSTFTVGLSRALATDVGINNANADPGVQEFLVAVRVWFRDYKLPDGKPANTFAFDDKYQSKVSVMAVQADHVHVVVAVMSPVSRRRVQHHLSWELLTGVCNPVRALCCRGSCACKTAVRKCVW